MMPMMVSMSALRKRRLAVQRGFTLLEVLVAMALIGIGFATAFVALSGSRRLAEKVSAHEVAMQIARAKLDEILHSKGNTLIEDKEGTKELIYAGQSFGYQVKIRPVAVPLAATPDEALVEDVGIEVFWGDKDAKNSKEKQHSYQLATMRMTPKALTLATPNPAAAAAAASAPASSSASGTPAAASANPFEALLRR